ncbi:NUMOD4 motif family protein [Bacteroides fragilis str. J-143-4]|uniref:NUMOD4 domain-containing protein n=1 Tax=Bacteroides fragilis TaxID=817 RepID=UPI000447BAF2|nr:NUMOD4 domain-containing protein [Bacteroides fragilis]EXZ16572.1 NUMOD4 motif family protein [Bacteroides fragilis str. J-143-4]
MKNEFWKAVEGYEGYYEISNKGRIKSIDRMVKQGGSLRIVRERYKKIHIGPYGYPCVTLCKDRKSKSIPVHLLMARNFIPNPLNKPFVDHINTNREDYRIENLRWVTAKENANNPLTLKHCKEKTYISDVSLRANITKRKKQTKTAPKPVFQFDKNGNFINGYESSREAQRHTGIHASSIRDACIGKRYSSGGFLWSYSKDNIPQYSIPTHTNAKAILQFDKEGTFIKEWESLKAVCKVYGSSPSNLSRSIKLGRFKGKYIWKFKKQD